ncbi:MAG TPA: GMP synthase (glutamine-hydrolyzing), partial [bacterium]|nr:GMP synthase (glutamine-hydrolyzing) [bacterium]HEX67881.1 GMP synthase (glutamine-hydrolyzing) [bacterium]
MEKVPVVILDFGSQYNQLIARRVRELNIYSQIFPYSISWEEISKYKPDAIILTGGPASVHTPDAPIPDKRIFEERIPLLGICYGMQVMVEMLGGKVVPSEKREYGKTTLFVRERNHLLEGWEEKE